MRSKSVPRCGAERSSMACQAAVDSACGQIREMEQMWIGRNEASKIASAWFFDRGLVTVRAPKSQFRFESDRNLVGPARSLFRRRKTCTAARLEFKNSMPLTLNASRFANNEAKFGARHIEKRGRVRSGRGSGVAPNPPAPHHVPGHRSAGPGVAQPRGAGAGGGRAPGRALALDHQQVGRSRVPQDVRGHTAHRRQRDHEAGEHVVRPPFTTSRSETPRPRAEPGAVGTRPIWQSPKS